MQRFVTPLIFASLLFLKVSGQVILNQPYPKSDFRAPLDLPPALSSSFGDIRSNHLHSGLDLRTNQREGYPVYAVGDGFIARLRVQIGGFGNVVYISHPNGYTSVYAHLQRFNPRIAKTIKDYQYSKEIYDIDFPLLPANIPVKKGEVIGWSGNTGGSAGPHLHFEIRDSKTEEIINPQLFGIKVPDKVKPVIKGVYLYQLNGYPFSETTPKRYFQAIPSGGDYQLKSPTVTVSTESGLGIVTSESIYSIELKIDRVTFFSSVFERFYFDHTLAANSYIDYPAYLNSGIIIRKSFVEPGNPLKIYPGIINYGLINLNDQREHSAEYIVKDVNGNTSTLTFKIKSAPSATPPPTPQGRLIRFFFDKPNNIVTNSARISIPAGALYSSINFNYSQSQRIPGGNSPVHNIHTRLIPLNAPYNLWIRPDSSLLPELQNKALIRDTRGKAYESSFIDGYVKAMPDRFGSFYITVDTISPVIRSLTLTDGKSMSGISKMTFKISDVLSGIKSFKGTIDGKWVLMEFDQKTATLWHTFDERTPPGKHVFQLEVIDNKMNTRTFTAAFSR